MKKKTVSILLPCLNEEETLEKCMKNIKKSMKNTKYEWEIIVCDNNSVDKSVSIAKKNNVKVIIETKKGYGATLLNGINTSTSDYLVMLDSDMSYNDKDIPMMLSYLDQNYDFVIGNRFKGNTQNDAFPFLHKTGTKALNFIANILFNTKVKDFHCGLRAFRRDKIKELKLKSSGMEFASEMVIKAKLHGLKIKQFNTDYKKDERTRKSHLRTFRDGFRHLRLILSIRYNTLGIFKYFLVFLLTLLILASILFLTIIIKNDNIQKNVVESARIYSKHNFRGYINDIFKDQKEYRVDFQTDIKMLSIAYLIKPNKPIDSLIRMDYYYDTDYGVFDFEDIFLNYSGRLLEYSRYWHGYIVYLRPLLLFFSIDNIYLINACILIILLVLLVKRLFKLDKLLCSIFLVSIIMVNSFIAPFCLEYFFIYLLLFIFSNLIITYYKKNKNIGPLLLVSGITTCFFDFLTAETLTLTIPLFIYVYLKKDKVKIKDIIKYIFIWGCGYAFMFLSKWIISTIYFGLDNIKDIYGALSIRVVSDSRNIFILIGSLFISLLSFIFPFNITSFSLALSLGFILMGIYFYIFDIKEKKDYNKLLIISMIPILRFIVLSGHSGYHMFFAYRAIIPLLMFLLLVYCKKFICK